MMIFKRTSSFLLVSLLLICAPLNSLSYGAQSLNADHPVESMVGESLEYDISFLWFERLATGSIELLQTDKPSIYLLRMQAQTRGVAAVFTRNRTELFETTVDIGADGRLRPLVHSSQRMTWRDPDSVSARTVRYTFDYDVGKIFYERIRNGRVSQEQWFDLDPEQPVYDILSAFYNLRLGFFDTSEGDHLVIPTFHHKVEQDIVVEPYRNPSFRDQDFFGEGADLYRVLIDPSVFGTSSRDVFVSFDDDMRLQRGIIKRISGIGDLRGVLRNP